MKLIAIDQMSRFEGDLIKVFHVMQPSGPLLPTYPMSETFLSFRSMAPEVPPYNAQ